MDTAQAEALRARLIPTGQRQYGRKLEEVKRNHVVRYDWVAQRTSGMHVLDAACGIGYGTWMLSRSGGATALGLEVDPDVVELAKHYYGGPGCQFECAELHSWEPPDGEYDAVVSFETIEHLVCPELFLVAAWRALAGAGKLYFSTPNALVEPHRLADNPYHLRHYTAAEVGDLAERCGFHVDQIYGQVGGIQDSQVVSEPKDPRFWVVECTRSKNAGDAFRRYGELKLELPRRFHEAFIDRCSTISSLRQSK